MGASKSGLHNDFASSSCFGDRKPGLGDLPEGCVALIVENLDPVEICSFSKLNRAFRGASSADFVWESKLPPNYMIFLEKILGGFPESLQKITLVSPGLTHSTKAPRASKQKLESLLQQWLEWEAEQDSLTQVTDGERLPLAVKELGTCDLYPQMAKYKSRDRFCLLTFHDAMSLMEQESAYTTGLFDALVLL